MPPSAAPPWFGTPDGPSFTRDKLVRPVQGRYIAGVCGALGRATNTDPVLWRVLLAVLGFFGGVGVLIYLIGWLAIPSEGDSASPIESLLGRGRSGMKPVSIVLLGGAAVLTFAFVVNDGFRAALLAVAVLIGAALLLKRNNTGSSAPPPPVPPPSTPDQEAATFATTAFAPSDPAAATAASAEPPTEPFPPVPPADPTPPQPSPSAPPSGDTAPSGGDRPPFAPPAGGYRPPFAPHGPWAGSAQQPYVPAPAQPKPPKEPKPPREKSKLGRITFFALVVVMGLLAVLDMAGLSVAVSAYFAAALATIALGLIVGAWLGRARGLIALAVVATIGLVISTGLERFGGQMGAKVYRPQSVAGIADRYDLTIGNATLDLRRVNFTGATQETTVQMKVGQVRVLLPETVDTTVDVQMSGGRAQVFGQEWDGRDLTTQEVTDLGVDGAGGGTLRLNLLLDTGNLEVTR